MPEDGGPRCDVVRPCEEGVDGEFRPHPDGVDGREGVEDGARAFGDVAAGEGEDFR